jgi:hypothetical protein
MLCRRLSWYPRIQESSTYYYYWNLGWRDPPTSYIEVSHCDLLKNQTYLHLVKFLSAVCFWIVLKLSFSNSLPLVHKRMIGRKFLERLAGLCFDSPDTASAETIREHPLLLHDVPIRADRRENTVISGTSIVYVAWRVQLLRQLLLCRCLATCLGFRRICHNINEKYAIKVQL